jgi:hypothetical protein
MELAMSAELKKFRVQALACILKSDNLKVEL